ncbi:MAG: hypothetical protein Q4G39_02885 [Brachymonas sp.]|nr:hypothetical protein [Brachymonas sp.]
MKVYKLCLGLTAALTLAGCAGVHYGHMRMEPVDQRAMDAASAQVRQAEREERAEARKERREMLMDEADAIRRAGGTQRPVYIID